MTCWTGLCLCLTTLLKSSRPLRLRPLPQRRPRPLRRPPRLFQSRLRLPHINPSFRVNPPPLRAAMAEGVKKSDQSPGLIFFVALDENVSYYQKVTAMMVSSWWGKGHRRDTPFPGVLSSISYPRTLRSGLHSRQSRRGVALSLSHQTPFFQRLPSGRAR